MPDRRRPQSESVAPWAIAAIAVTSAAALATATAAFVTARFSRSVVIPTDSVDESLRIHSVDIDIDIDIDSDSNSGSRSGSNSDSRSGSGSASASGSGTITLAVTADSIVPGRYSLWFDGGGGHARVGGIVSIAGGLVTRTVDRVDYGRLQDARWGRLGSWYYLDPREFGLRVDDVVIETELGPAPAWLTPAVGPAGQPSDRWVIAVHGRGVRKAETIRAVPLFHDLGYTGLQISYRNDGEAPPSPDGRYALGDTEWHDVDAAMRYAVEHGARQIVLMGWSMGGATVLQAATRSEWAPYLSGVILDSPVVAWSDTIVFQGHLNHLPESISKGVMATIGSSVGRPVTGQSQPIDFKRLDFVARAAEIAFPLLILHSDDDGFVPSTASRRLADARPDLVTLIPFSVAKHVRLWNYDPERYLGSIRAWMRAQKLA